MIDNGTGYTKMGYAGSEEPSYVIPTLIGHPVSQQGGAAMRKGGEGLGDMDFYIGNEALMRKKTYPVTSPIKQGIIEVTANLVNLSCLENIPHDKMPLIELESHGENVGEIYIQLPQMRAGRALLPLDGASFQHAREPRVHRRSYVRNV